MIQRPQTLFLLASAILMVLAVRLVSWSVMSDDVMATTNAYQVKVFSLVDGGEELKTSEMAYYPAILGGLSTLISLISIFKFKNRIMQMKLGLLNSITIVAYVGLIYFMNIPLAQSLAGTQDIGVFEVGFYLPLAAVLMNTLANRFIKKDEDLIRSVDRIR